MATNIGRSRGHWRNGMGRLRWDEDARRYATLLDALTRDLSTERELEAEMNATARRSLAEVQDEEGDLLSADLEHARRELTVFRAALDDALARSGGNMTAEVRYDGADALQDIMADALIQYLVRPGYGAVRTEEREPGRYMYFVTIDWARLDRLADAHARPI